MAKKRRFLPYADALRCVRAFSGAVVMFAEDNVGWADQGDAALHEARTTLLNGRQDLVGPHGDIRELTPEHGTVIGLQVLFAAMSAGAPLVTCEHTRTPMMVSGERDLPILASPTPRLLVGDPSVMVCISCSNRLEVQRAIGALRPAYPDECDRCGGPGPITMCAAQAGAVVVRYGSCDRCLDSDRTSLVRSTAFGPVTGDPR